MQLSERDKKLLLVLVIVAIIFLPYFFVIEPLFEKCDTLNNDIADLQSELRYQETLALQEEEYGNASQQLDYASAELLNRFPSELPQEGSILFIHNTEQIIPISLYQVSFGDDVAAQITSDSEAQAIDDVEAATGDVTDDSVIRDNTVTTNLGGGLTGIQTQTRFSYDAGYDEFQSFLKYIMDYKDRMVITELDATYSAELNRVSGSFSLTQYALSGGGREGVQVQEPDMLQGTTNIFKQAAGNFGTEDTGTSTTPDFFILLNQPDADVDSLIIGQSSDVTEETYFTSSKNDSQEVTITFTGEDGNYNANYQIGKSSYSEDGIDFTKKGDIRLQIISSERLNNQDKVAIDLNIVNRTDAVVNVETLNEDSTNPRVTVKGKTGDIILN
jgi:type II secretory pathway component PulM